MSPSYESFAISLSAVLSFFFFFLSESMNNNTSEETLGRLGDRRTHNSTVKEGKERKEKLKHTLKTCAKVFLSWQYL